MSHLGIVHEYKRVSEAALYKLKHEINTLIKSLCDTYGLVFLIGDSWEFMIPVTPLGIRVLGDRTITGLVQLLDPDLYELLGHPLHDWDVGNYVDNYLPPFSFDDWVYLTHDGQLLPVSSTPVLEGNRLDYYGPMSPALGRKIIALGNERGGLDKLDELWDL